jgi:hypothetical protein
MNFHKNPVEKYGGGYNLGNLCMIKSKTLRSQRSYNFKMACVLTLAEKEVI